MTLRMQLSVSYYHSVSLHHHFSGAVCSTLDGHKSSLFPRAVYNGQMLCVPTVFFLVKLRLGDLQV